MSDNFLADSALQQAVQRRTFLRVAGASATAAALVLTGCADDAAAPVTPTNIIILQAGEKGLINYLFFLKQLQAALYTKIVATPPADLTTEERRYFADLHDHEVIHRETLKYALGADGLPTLGFTFTSLTLGTRAGVLAAAQLVEDLGSAAFLGVLPLFSTAVLQALVLKMASVEARHAALVRDLVLPGSFAGSAVVDVNNGQAIAKTPTEVIAATAAFLETYTISVANLPTV